MNQWLLHKGPAVLRELGIQKDMNLLDFGCRHGTYSIPAAGVVGKKGKVVALDKERESLLELKQRNEFNLENILCIQGDETILHFFSSQFFDVVLLFDVIHLIKDRAEFLKSLQFILSTKGMLCVYPRHHQEKMQLNLSEVIQEIEKAGFTHRVTYEGVIMHDDTLVSDDIIVFSKQ